MAFPLVPVLLGLGALAFLATRGKGAAQAPSGPSVVVKHGDKSAQTIAVGQQLQIVEPSMDWTPGLFAGVSQTMGKDDGTSPLMMLGDYGGPQGKVFIFKAVRPGRAGINIVSQPAGQSDVWDITVVGS